MMALSLTILLLLLTGCTPSSVPQPIAPMLRNNVLQAHEYLMTVGYGDIGKGAIICQRVADTAARAELAKLIRVHVMEQARERVRESSGKPIEQDIEVIREELVNELLSDVRIVDRKVDKAAGTCSSTAVMPKRKLTSKAAEDSPPNPRAPER